LSKVGTRAPSFQRLFVELGVVLLIVTAIGLVIIVRDLIRLIRLAAGWLKERQERGKFS